MKNIQNMVVVAGPSGVGKSTLIAQIVRGEHPELSRTLHFDATPTWEKRNAAELERSSSRAKTFSHLIFHYDIMRPVLRGYRDGFSTDPALMCLLRASAIRIMTLWAPDDILISRLSTRTSLPFRRALTPLNLPVRIARKRRYARLRRMYQKPNLVEQQYASWFDFTQTGPSGRQHLVIDVSRVPLRFQTAGAWLQAALPDPQEKPKWSHGCGAAAP